VRKWKVIFTNARCWQNMSAETIDLYLICTSMQSLNRGTDDVPSKNGKMYEKMSRNNAKKVLGTNETHGTHYSARGKSSVPGRVQSREASTLPNELPEEPDQFRFLLPACFLDNLKGSMGLILAKASVMSLLVLTK
jgi:hypothetical protein